MNRHVASAIGVTTMTKPTVLIALVSAAALAACKSKPAPAQQPPATPRPATLATTAPAVKPVPAPKPRTKEPMPAAYRDALALGRKLTAGKQYAEAAAAFQTALSAVPEDARALSELSWALFLGKDLDKAKPAAELAVRLGRNNVKAASLYNLGRILEAEDAGPEAANAYRESLALRPNKTVAERLAKLDPSASAAAALLEIEEWGPPAASRPATCEALGEDDSDYAAWSQNGNCEVTATEVSLAGAGEPFKAVTQLARKRSGSDEAFVAVQTADGWLLSPPFLSWGGVGTWGASGSITRAEVVTHPKLGPVLRIDVRTSESGRWENWETDATVFCTASRPGGAGALTCSPLLATSWLHSQDDDAAVDESCAATIGLAADGSVSVVSKTGKSPTDCPIHVGRFAWPPAR